MLLQQLTNVQSGLKIDPSLWNLHPISPHMMCTAFASNIDCIFVVNIVGGSSFITTYRSLHINTGYRSIGFSSSAWSTTSYQLWMIISCPFSCIKFFCVGRATKIQRSEVLIKLRVDPRVWNLDVFYILFQLVLSSHDVYGICQYSSVNSLHVVNVVGGKFHIATQLHVHPNEDFFTITSKFSAT